MKVSPVVLALRLNLQELARVLDQLQVSGPQQSCYLVEYFQNKLKTISAAEMDELSEWFRSCGN